ncbi:MAG: SBBP repeat-containing protein [Ignavibacteria bacterium]|nr:SBBP repeat-containing protein [Ignavibacteria bacterium]
MHGCFDDLGNVYVTGTAKRNIF